MMICKKCGREIKKGAKYCPSCGTKVSGISGSPGNSKKNPNKRIPRISWVIIISLMIMIILSGIAIFVIKRGVFESASIFKKQDKSTVTYENGDFVYVPTEESIEVDEATGIEYFNNLITVYLKENLPIEKREELADIVNGHVVSNLSGCINTMDIMIEPTDYNNIDKKSKQLMELDEIQFATYSFPVFIESNTRDLWDGEKDLGNESNPDGADWWAEAVKCYTAWDFEDYTEDVVVGIMDNGFQTDHDDFEKDGNSIIHMLNDNSIDLEDPIAAHGTHVAGLIAAQNNRIGMTGVANKAEIICIDLPFSDTTPLPPSLIEANLKMMIEQAKERNAPIVINNSWCNDLTREDLDYKNNLKEYKEGITLTDNQFYNLASSINAAQIVSQLLTSGEQDFIIVQSAGNGYDGKIEGYDTKYAGWFSGIDQELCERHNIPVPFDIIKSHLIIVGAVEKDKSGKYKLTKISNYGNNIDLVAPGKKIYSTVLDNEYGYLSGTSMAAPIVAGTAAYIWSLNRSLEASEVKDTLINTAGAAVGVNPDDSRPYYPMLNAGAAAVSTSMGVATCKVVDSTTGNPISGVICKRHNDVSDAEAFSSDLTTDNDTLYAPAIGNTVFKFEKEGYKPVEIKFSIGAHEDHDLGTIKMEPKVADNPFKLITPGDCPIKIGDYTITYKFEDNYNVFSFSKDGKEVFERILYLGNAIITNGKVMYYLDKDVTWWAIDKVDFTTDDFAHVHYESMYESVDAAELKDYESDPELCGYKDGKIYFLDEKYPHNLYVYDESSSKDPYEKAKKLLDNISSAVLYGNSILCTTYNDSEYVGKLMIYDTLSNKSSLLGNNITEMKVIDDKLYYVDIEKYIDEKNIIDGVNYYGNVYSCNLDGTNRIQLLKGARIEGVVGEITDSYIKCYQYTEDGVSDKSTTINYNSP